MLLSRKQIAVLITAFLAVSSVAHAQDHVTDSPRAAVLRKVFGDSVVNGLQALSPLKFKGAREMAMDLAQQVQDHELNVKEARNSLLAILEKMDRGVSPSQLPDTEIQVVGVMPRGESPAGKELPGASEALVAAAPGQSPDPSDAELAGPAVEPTPPVEQASALDKNGKQDDGEPNLDMDAAPPVQATSVAEPDAEPDTQERGVSSVGG
ncbi:MAG: hypothetical protein HY074_06065 [Deltaproteobacteria bacterium]|nr:hypothetical protein [Deltaproteobacteria bacterium]